MAKETDISTALPNYSNKSKNNPTSDSLKLFIIFKLDVCIDLIMPENNESDVGLFFDLLL
jgi:hypothetical protein